MNAQHTPGPWEAEGETRHGELIVRRAKDRMVVAVLDQGGLGRPLLPNGEGSANARLIAAAPGHDECLWNAVALFGSLCTDEPQMVWLAQAKASLAKARGEAA